MRTSIAILVLVVCVCSVDELQAQKPVLPQPDPGGEPPSHCPNSWSLQSSLTWQASPAIDWDLHLVTPRAHIYYGNWGQTVDGFILNYDAQPQCTPTPTPPERITGVGQCGIYRLYSNLYSFCSSTQPKKTFSATVTASTSILINGKPYSNNQTFTPRENAAFSVDDPNATPGPTPLQDPDAHREDDKSVPDDCGGPGMARYRIDLLAVSLRITDTPIEYTPARGPKVNFTATYSQRDSDQDLLQQYSNLGPNWTIGWVSYVTDNPSDNPNQGSGAAVYLSGGGTENFSNFNSGSYQADPQSHAVLARTSTNPITYERRLPDGSKQVFTKSNGASTYPRLVFMTQIVDPQGNHIDIHYDALNRIDTVTDALLQVTNLFYEHASDIRKVTKVTDPFGHSANLTYYDTPGPSPDIFLTSIEDPEHIFSQFGYEFQSPDDVYGSRFFTLITPYETLRFSAKEEGPFVGGNGTNRSLFVLAEDNSTLLEKVEYRDAAPEYLVNGTDPDGVPAGTGFVNAEMNLRNTFYWNRETIRFYGPNVINDYNKAEVTHWLRRKDGRLTSGVVSSEKKPLERRIWYTYEGQTNFSSVNNSAKPSQKAQLVGGSTQLWSYQYNSVGNITQIKDPDPNNRVTSFKYFPGDVDLEAVYQKRPGGGSTDPFGNPADEIARYTYNAQHPHLPSSIRDGAGQLTQYDYTPQHQLWTVTNPKGEITTYAYGPAPGVPSGYLASITSPAVSASPTPTSAVTRFEYNFPPGNSHPGISKQTDPDGYFRTFDYDKLNRITQITYPDTTFELFIYSEGGAPKLDLIDSIDRRGVLTRRHYDAHRNMDRITEGANSTTDVRTTFYNWCGCGSLDSITDGEGRTTNFIRDPQGRVTRKQYLGGSGIDYLYEGQPGPNTVGATSRIASTTDARGQRTSYTYSGDGNVATISYTGSNPPTPGVSYLYDGNYNRLWKMFDGTGTTIYSYHPVGTNGGNQLKDVDGPLSSDVISYGYDSVGRKISQSVNGVASGVDYDPLGRISDINNAALGHFTPRYDGVTSRLASVTADATGQRTNYHYPNGNQDRRLDYMENLSAFPTNLSRFEYQYHDDGQIKKWTKILLDGTASDFWFEYDNSKRLTTGQNGDPEHPEDVTQKLVYGYDDAGNRTSDANYNPNHLPSHGVYNSYQINELNQVETRTPGGAAAGEDPQVFAYDSVGNMTSDGAGKTFEWDAANRLSAINYIVSGNRTEFAYDGLGRRVKITEYGPGMTADIEPTGAVYTSFVAGKFMLPDEQCTLTLQGLNPSGGDNTMLVDSITFDSVLMDNGSFETPNTDNYEVPLTGATWSFSGTAGVAANGGTYGNPQTIAGNQAAFVRNHGSVSQSFSLPAGKYKLELKAAQRIGNESSQRLRVILRSPESITSTKTFIWCGNRICEERSATGTKRFFAEGEQWIGEGEGVYYYTRDHLGSIRELTDSIGDVLAQYDYDPYGNRVTLIGKMNTDFGYTGHYYHAQSGLTLTPYRAYNPALGRWINREPLDNAEIRQGPNLYSYSYNDPINKVDPLGLDAFVYNTGGTTGHTAFVITDPSGGVLIFHQFAEGHGAGNGLSSSLKGLVYDNSNVWYQEAPSIEQWLADNGRAGNSFTLELGFPGSAATDREIIEQLKQLAESDDIPYSYIGGKNCHDFAYNWLIKYAQREARSQLLR